MMNKKFDNFSFVFHATDENKSLINEKINNSNLENVSVISDEKIKDHILNKSINLLFLNLEQIAQEIPLLK